VTRCFEPTLTASPSQSRRACGLRGSARTRAPRAAREGVLLCSPTQGSERRTDAVVSRSGSPAAWCAASATGVSLSSGCETDDVRQPSRRQVGEEGTPVVGSQPSGSSRGDVDRKSLNRARTVVSRRPRRTSAHLRQVGPHRRRSGSQTHNSGPGTEPFGAGEFLPALHHRALDPWSGGGWWTTPRLPALHEGHQLRLVGKQPGRLPERCHLTIPNLPGP